MTLDQSTDVFLLAAELTKSVFARNVAIAARDPRQMPDTMDPSEDHAVSGAVPRRRAEFHAGRAAARAGMVALGLPPRPVPSDLDRAPIWPEGVVGSISHCRSVCVAALGHTKDWASIGVDLEEDTPLAGDLVPIVCGAAEQSWLRTQNPAERGIMAKLIFCAKEATYKAQYPLTGALFGFDHLEVRIDHETARFNARFLADAGGIRAGTVMNGRYAHAAGVLVTGMALDHSVVGRG